MTGDKLPARLASNRGAQEQRCFQISQLLEKTSDFLNSKETVLKHGMPNFEHENLANLSMLCQAWTENQTASSLQIFLLDGKDDECSESIQKTFFKKIF